jgi:hypothetical protein
MIEKLIQDNVVVLRTICLPRDKLVHLRDEVDWCASVGSACEESVCVAKADFELFHIIFLSSVDYLHCLLFVT